MQHNILVTKQPNNGYLARPILMPEIVVSGDNEQDVLDRVSEAIADMYAASHIVRIDVPVPKSTTDDPWLRFAGMWGDDEAWAQFQADIDEFRRDIDAGAHDDPE